VALSTDGPGRIASLDPYVGGVLAVCEAARNVACAGARPLAITNCLNFGPPERPETMWDFAEAVRGMGDACRAFGIPVTGGNVSFYNESPLGAVHPTPVVGMLGGMDDAYAHRPPAPRRGEAVLLLGETRPELGGSEALAVRHGVVSGRPPVVEASHEVALCGLLADPTIGTHAHDLSEGGLGVALAELCLGAGSGAHVRLPRGADPLWGLFGESTGRALVTCAPDDAGRVLDAARAAGVGAEAIGELRGENLRIEGALDVPLDDLRDAFEGAIPGLMDT
jgi:phosphoribosylformylglycinamidine synthase